MYCQLLKRGGNTGGAGAIPAQNRATEKKVGPRVGQKKAKLYHTIIEKEYDRCKARLNLK